MVVNYSFIGHCQFLHKEHRFRLIHSLFNDKTELREALEHLSGSDIFKQVKGLNVTFEKPLEPMDTSKRVRGKIVVEVVGAEQWKKREVYFFLHSLLGDELVMPFSRCHAYREKYL